MPFFLPTSTSDLATNVMALPSKSIRNLITPSIFTHRTAYVHPAPTSTLRPAARVGCLYKIRQVVSPHYGPLQGPIPHKNQSLTSPDQPAGPALELRGPTFAPIPWVPGKLDSWTFLELSGHNDASGPLHLLLPLPRSLFPSISAWLTSFSSLFEYHLPNEDFSISSFKIAPQYTLGLPIPFPALSASPLYALSSMKPEISVFCSLECAIPKTPPGPWLTKCVCVVQTWPSLGSSHGSD